MASVRDLQAQRVENNNTRTLLNSEGVYEAAEDNSSQLILENPDPDIVKTISHYFEAALSGQKYVLSHPVTDHGTESSADRDSGDSLFITQVPVSEVVRSVRRCHSKERSEFTCTIESEEESGEEDGPATPQRKQQVSHAMKHHKRKAEKHGLKKYSFPFLGSVYRSKPLSSRERTYRNTHLPLLKSVTFSSKAIGGFFRCVKTLKKFSKGKATLASALPNRYLDEEGELSPLSEQEVESEGSDDDIRVVENTLLMPFLKKKNRQTWCHPSSEAEKQCRKFSSVSKYFTKDSTSVSKDSTAKTKKRSTKKTQHLPHVKQTLSLVSKMIKDTPSKRSFAGSRRIVPEKCNMAEKETNPESMSCVRRCSSGRSLVRNETEEPGIHLADNTDGHEENDNMDISLTEWKTMLNIGFVSEEVEGTRIDQAVDITSSPINEVQESEGSCLERTQVGRAMTPSVTGQSPDRDHQNQTRETEADPGTKGHNPPSTEPELTDDCTNVDVGGDYEQKGKKRKKKNRKREGGDGESIEERVGQPPCQEAPDYQELVTCVSTSTIQGGEATERTQDNKAEHSVSASGEMIMPQKKKRKKERRRDSPCHADTDIGLKQEENPKLSSHAGGGAIVQTEDIELKKMKKKYKNSTAHAILEEGPEKGHFPNLSLESQLDEVIGPQKGTNISTLPEDTVTNLQVNATDIRQKTIECSIVQLTKLVAQRKKHKTMAPIDNSLAQSDGTIYFRKKKKAKKDGDSCSNEMVGNYTEIPLTTSILSQSGQINTLEKKKRKRDKKQNSDIHEDSEARPKENVVSHERSEDKVTEKKRKKKKRRKSSTDDGAVVQQQEDNIQKFHITLKSSVSESNDTVPPRKKRKKDRDLVAPLSTEERHQKDSIPPETDEITSPRKMKKKKRDGSKDTCSVIHKDTAAPLEKESIGISLEGCERSALTPDDTVSQRKTKKNKNSLTKHDPEGRLKNDATKISQRMSATVKNSRPEEKKEIDTTEVRLEAESAFISLERKRKKTKRWKSTDYEVPAVGHQDNDYTAILIETTQSSMTQYTETESQKKKKKINDNTAMLIETTQSSMTQYTETESQKKKKKKINDNTAMLIETTQSSMTQYTETESQKKKKKKRNDNTAMLIETTQSSMTQYTETESQKKKKKINDNTAMLIETTQSSMTQYTETESQKKKKKINDNTAMLIETTQSSMTQYTETESQKKKKKINRKTNKESVAPKHTDGRQTGEMSEATSDCLPLPQINPDPVSISHELVSSAEKKKKKKKKKKHGKDANQDYLATNTLTQW
ncbi:E3 ubiquitin-protein ligase RBBP6-like isoform X2 [Salvelinus namaycush]|uniref:E3 ubiquitin-protein ligase RBBP6-like isoform X2 n=1 Tax=Salvelinus namaycush TaxID=8040 RepID=A0A8U1ETH1_SALNM|nr:E3 ubiquitin-protein ligase RBBP6-like isoform X2 [Salvelinus namaycush]